MFLLGPTGTTRAPVAKARSALAPQLPCGPVHVVPMGTDRELAWFRGRSSDGLHSYRDGVVVGLLALDEPGDDAPQVHDGPLPDSVAPLMSAATITNRGVVRPANITNVFWSGDRASDSQLVLADAAGLRPSPFGVAVMCAVGHLVGDETLFAEARRITLAHELDMSTGRQQPTQPLPLVAPDGGDDAFIDHLLGLLPSGGHHHLALSGGVDSRAILGLLVARGLRPTAVALRNRDHDELIAEQIAAALELEVHLAPTGAAAPETPDAVYTLATDAQLYFGGARWSRLAPLVVPDSIVHFGLMGEGVFKNAFGSVWKRPTSLRRVPTAAVERGLLGRAPARLTGLRAPIGRSELIGTLRDRFDRLDALVPLSTRRQHANWVFFHSRAVRWGQASAAELTAARGTCLAGDLTAWLIASRSGAWENHAHQRIRAVTQRLLPDVTVPYASGLPAAPPSGIAGVKERLEYDYLIRLRARRRALSTPPLASVTRTVDRPLVTPPGFLEHFEVPLDSLGPVGATLSTRRAARTIADVLRYLDLPRAGPETGDDS